MTNPLRLIALVCLLAAGVAGRPAAAEELPVSERGVQLAAELDRMDVEHKWLAGIHVNWETGLPDNRPERSPGQHTHCSAFVAAAAEALGVYILRPPAHSEILLANAQNEWLETEGAHAGWRRLRGPVEAQMAANRGDLVVATYHNHNPARPGHIAIIRPSRIALEEVIDTGPQAMMAGTINRAAISVRAGFAAHPTAWSHDEIGYFVHSLSPL